MNEKDKDIVLTIMPLNDLVEQWNDQKMSQNGIDVRSCHRQSTNSRSCLPCHSSSTSLRSVTARDYLSNEQAHPINYNQKTKFLKNIVAPWVSPVMDTHTLIVVCRNLGITGTMTTKTIQGQEWVIFNGYPGLRKILTSPKYTVKNQKVIKMAIGKAGVKNMVKSGGILTIVLCGGLNVLEYIFNDKSTITSFIGTMATDIAKVGISTIIGTIFGLVAGTVTTVASFPIVVAIGFAIGTSLILEGLDSKYHLTQKLIAALDAASSSIDQKMTEAGKAGYKGARAVLKGLPGGFDIRKAENYSPF